MSKTDVMKSLTVGFASLSGFLLGGSGIAMTAAALSPLVAGVAWLLRPPVDSRTASQ
jgi:hypothetical protein